MTDTLLGFFLFWGIWLFVPLLIDGSTAISYLIGAWRYERSQRGRRSVYELESFPTIAIVIPVHNGEEYLAHCLESMRRQTYPHEKIHIVVVDNQSTDRTREVFEEEMSKPFEGHMDLVSLAFKGKAWALNAGIHMSNTDFVCNVDSDTILADDAIHNLVRAFVHDPKLAAATGTVEVLPPESKGMHPFRFAMAQAEFVEYHVAFRVGRQYQSVTKSLFTLAGAFSCFRREVLLQTNLYNNLTVSEDTDLTFNVYEKFPEMHVMTVSEAVAYVEPSPSLAALYSQRVRWQRGELEVMALHPEQLRNPLRLRGISTTRSLLIDHTLAFPRIAWTFLLPLMSFLGYPLGLVLSAMGAMYIAYVFFDALYMLTGYAMADGRSKARLRGAWWVFAFLPIFRYITFWFRIGGFLEVFMEPPQWRVQSPWVQTMDGLVQLRVSAVSLLSHVSSSRVVSVFVNIFRGG
ncbi:MAG: glycosyltransferase [Chloroflexi bacterium]|nr:glycosyltransferase [Chloroflexota bacterium]